MEGNKMTQAKKEFEKERDESAKQYGGDRIYEGLHKNGYTACLDSSIVKRMEKMITDWLAFEAACIAKDGPYVSPNIPKHMDAAKYVLNDLAEIRKGSENE